MNVSYNCFSRYECGRRRRTDCEDTDRVRIGKAKREGVGRVTHGVIADRLASREPGRRPVERSNGGRWYSGVGCARRPLFVSGRILVALCAPHFDRASRAAVGVGPLDSGNVIATTSTTALAT